MKHLIGWITAVVLAVVAFLDKPDSPNPHLEEARTFAVKSIIDLPTKQLQQADYSCLTCKDTGEVPDRDTGRLLPRCPDCGAVPLASAPPLDPCRCGPNCNCTSCDCGPSSSQKISQGISGVIRAQPVQYRTVCENGVCRVVPETPAPTQENTFHQMTPYSLPAQPAQVVYHSHSRSSLPEPVTVVTRVSAPTYTQDRVAWGSRWGRRRGQPIRNTFRFLFRRRCFGCR